MLHSKTSSLSTSSSAGEEVFDLLTDTATGCYKRVQRPKDSRQLVIFSSDSSAVVSLVSLGRSIWNVSVTDQHAMYEQHYRTSGQEFTQEFLSAAVAQLTFGTVTVLTDKASSDHDSLDSPSCVKSIKRWLGQSKSRRRSGASTSTNKLHLTSTLSNLGNTWALPAGCKRGKGLAAAVVLGMDALSTDRHFLTGKPSVPEHSGPFVLPAQHS